MSIFNRKKKRAELGEQSDISRGSEMERTNVERSDRTMGAGAHGDRMAGAEGIEDPALEQREGRERSTTDESESENPLV
ncbi:MAG: hypothetical protein ACT4O1_11270 [Gemmatimonadota bacterium]